MMGTDLDLRQEFEKVELFIKESIFIELTKHGIDSDRLYFTDFCFVRYDNERFEIFNTNTIDELCDILKNNHRKVVFNINGTYAGLIDDYLLYKDLDINDFKKEFNWSDKIKWGYLKK